MEKLAARLADSKTGDLMLGNPWPDGLRAESLTKFARGAPSKWWQCCGLRAKSQWPMWHSRFGLPSCQRAVRHCCSRGQRRTTQYPTDCGVVYSEVYAGAHTVLLPSVWSAVACGEDGFGQCNVCHQSGHHRLVVMAGWFFARLLCLLSPVPTVLRMISDVKGHDMKDHWWSLIVHDGGYHFFCEDLVAFMYKYVQLDLITKNRYPVGNNLICTILCADMIRFISILESWTLCRGTCAVCEKFWMWRTSEHFADEDLKSPPCTMWQRIHSFFLDVWTWDI